MTNQESTPFCIGHRGAKGYVAENTLASFEKALSLGCVWIELDVYLIEGELLVIHDKSVDRTTNGKGLLKELNLDYVRSLDAGDGQQVPTLREVIDMVNHRAKINVELKGEGTAVATNELLNEHMSSGWHEEDFLISSFNHDELDQADKRFRRGALFGKLTDDLWERAERLEPWSVNFDKKIVTQSLVDDAHTRGYKVLVYTVNKAPVIRKMLKLGVDGIFSDYPDRVISILAEQ